MLTLPLAAGWQILNIRREQSPETEMMFICWNYSWDHSKWTYFVAGFTNLSPLCTRWLQPRFHSLYRVLSALPVITIFVGYKPSKRSFGISIFVETLIVSNPTGRIFVFERCARESTLNKIRGLCAGSLFSWKECVWWRKNSVSLKDLLADTFHFCTACFQCL